MSTENNRKAEVEILAEEHQNQNAILNLKKKSTAAEQQEDAREEMSDSTAKASGKKERTKKSCLSDAPSAEEIEKYEMNILQNINSISELRPSRLIKYCKALFLSNGSTHRKSSFYKKHPENIYLETEDGETIGAFLYKPVSVNSSTHFYVLCHGKGCDRYHTAALFDGFEMFCALKNAVILVLDYRGFGDSTGKFSISGANIDVLEAFKYLRMVYRAERINIIGHSLGTAIALEYAKFSRTHCPEYVPKKIVLLAPFSNTIEICRDFKLFQLFTFLIPRLENKIKKEFYYDSVENAKSVSEGLHIFHGEKDRIIHIKHAEKISEASACSLVRTKHTHLTIFTDKSLWDKIIEITQNEE
ncbi:hypothetical protein ENBRE01_0808 [Enteropsectra breve]|nr:hypothetical protein ENBRE01_0808 [Enteropsectra breve]